MYQRVHHLEGRRWDSRKDPGPPSCPGGAWWKSDLLKSAQTFSMQHRLGFFFIVVFVIYNPNPCVPGSKETAYLYAITSAGVVHAVAKACSSGNLTECNCDSFGQGRTTSEGWKWGGCRWYTIGILTSVIIMYNNNLRVRYSGKNFIDNCLAFRFSSCD